MYIDAHTHLDTFGENLDKAIALINHHHIITFASSMDIKSYELNKEYSKRSPYIIPSFAIHPWRAADYKGDLKDLIPYIEESKFIGEIGLDYVWVEDSSTYGAQRKVFNFLLEQSVLRNKVIVLHTKGAEEEIFNAVNHFNYNKVIVHWYSGPLDILDKFIKLGCYFTISVDMGYSDLTLEVLKKIPLDKLLVETDGPTALEWVNGGYGYPDVLKEVVKKVADYKKMDAEELKKQIYHNVCTLFDTKELS